jgi:methionyl-tRNA formyltransferase
MSAFAAAMARNFFVYEPDASIGQSLTEACISVCERAGLTRCFDPDWAAFAFAPLLRRKLSPADFNAPEHGTLIFHPSALPYRRGSDAIRQTLAAEERVSAATWFFADERLDAGPICEQELVLLDPTENARSNYLDRFVPAAVRAFERAVDHFVATSEFRRVQQDERFATYDAPLARTG